MSSVQNRSVQRTVVQRSRSSKEHERKSSGEHERKSSGEHERKEGSRGSRLSNVRRRRRRFSRGLICVTGVTPFAISLSLSRPRLIDVVFFDLLERSSDLYRSIHGERMRAACLSLFLFLFLFLVSERSSVKRSVVSVAFLYSSVRRVKRRRKMRRRRIRTRRVKPNE